MGKTWTKIVNGIAGERFRARGARGSDAQGTPLRRHAARHLHLVRRRRPLGVVEPQPRRHPGVGPDRRGRRPRDRHARPELLRPRSHRAAAAVQRQADGRHRSDPVPPRAGDPRREPPRRSSTCCASPRRTCGSKCSTRKGGARALVSRVRTANAADAAARRAVAAVAAAAAPATAPGKAAGMNTLRVGHALRAGGQLPGDDSLGRLEDRPRGGAGQVHRAPHRRRPVGDPAARREAPPAARSDRRRPARRRRRSASPSATRSTRRTRPSSRFATSRNRSPTASGSRATPSSSRSAIP